MHYYIIYLYNIYKYLNSTCSKTNDFIKFATNSLDNLYLSTYYMNYLVLSIRKMTETMKSTS